MEPKAVVDLGTQSCLLLVGHKGRAGELVVLEDLCEIPRLGAGLDQSGVIGEEALVRVEEVLVRYRDRALAWGCKQLRVGGTAALRRAGNQAEVIERLTALGCAVEVIGEQHEARLGWQAVAGGEPATCIVDVGGGSTEIVAEAGEFLRSAPVGASVLAERLGEGGWEELLGEARRVLGDLGEVPGSGGAWVALGGTGVNLACLVLGLSAFDHLAAEGCVSSVSDVLEWGAHLAELSIEERCRFPIEPQRAAVIPAGLACLAAALEGRGVQRFRISGRGLRFGYLCEVLNLG